MNGSVKQMSRNESISIVTFLIRELKNSSLSPTKFALVTSFIHGQVNAINSNSSLLADRESYEMFMELCSDVIGKP